MARKPKRKRQKQAHPADDQHDEDERTPGEEGDEGAEHMSRADAEDDDEEPKVATGPVAGHIEYFQPGDGGATTQIVIDKGRNSGVTEGMRGYVKGADGTPLATIYVNVVRKRNSIAVVSMARVDLEHALEGSSSVVINDSKTPVEREARNLSAQIVNLDGDSDGALLYIRFDKGTKHGVVLGMTVVAELKGGKKFFTVDSVLRTSATAWGYGEPDEVKDDKVVINPISSGSKQKGRGKSHHGAGSHATGP